MTPTQTFSTDEQKAAYVAGAESALEDARMALAKTIDGPRADQDAAWSDYRQAMEHVKGCKLDVYGVTCPTCDGAMTVTWGLGAPWDGRDCPTCSGWGKVLPEVAAKLEDGQVVERDSDDWYDNVDRAGA